MLRDHHPKKLMIFSRDEAKQHEMRTGGFDHPTLRYFIGDVRDAGRLQRAMEEADIVVHAAALKQSESDEISCRTVPGADQVKGDHNGNRHHQPLPAGRGAMDQLQR